ncbi:MULTISPECIES: hypothetical protein [unclassified Enterococcus]|uniref:hypothetical protein n=1 Tax=unclassified Enterococcus TaxID=2608891 RepID=UPI00259B0521|nr:MULTISPECIES: hypothetical protein [unclassified Enterococcus]MDO0919903.1 hypothetical protein [Enterococcus sp. B1E2]MDO0920427.1 hypothetical protein [Enterococcus sp. B1E2]WIV14295.1 hypothetical protein QN079_09905 [Enterococcus sp. FZMF]WIV16984.1 hypothetical protein QN079_07725 [Enterococcus sp. FZMF]
MMKVENLSTEAFREDNIEKKKIIKKFIESFKNDIIVVKTKGDNDGNFRDERTNDKNIRHSIRK